MKLFTNKKENMKNIEFNGANAQYNINLNQRKIAIRTFQKIRHNELKNLLFLISQEGKLSLEKIMHFDIDFRTINAD